MYREIKLIVTDLDKTLLHDDLTLSEATITCFNRLKKRGILTAIASTRPSISIKPYADILGADYIISCGGALIEFDGQAVDSEGISSQAVSGIISELRFLGMLGKISIVTSEGDVFCNSSDNHPDYVIPKISDFHEPIEGIIIKLIVETEEENFAFIRKKYTSYEITNYRDEKWCRIANINATKEFAVRKVAKLNNILDDEILCFGDDFSDCGMLENFNGVAVENAIVEAKRKSKAITLSNNDDGVAVYISKNILFEV